MAELEIVNENEINRIHLSVLLTLNSEIIEASLWCSSSPERNRYLTTYTLERFAESEKRLTTGDYSRVWTREFLFQRVGAIMSIGADEVKAGYSLASPSPVYVYRKISDSAEMLNIPQEIGKRAILRALEYILIETRY